MVNFRKRAFPGDENKNNYAQAAKRDKENTVPSPMTIKMQSMRSSLAGSPTRRKADSNAKDEDQDLLMVARSVGSSFFSDIDDHQLDDLVAGDDLMAAQATQKYRILSIVSATPNKHHQIVLQCIDSQLQSMVTVHLSGLWIECDYQPSIHKLLRILN